MSVEAGKGTATVLGAAAEGGEFVFNPWKLKEYRRLYVNRADGTKVGYLDLETLTPMPEPPGTAAELERALGGLVPGRAPAAPPVPAQTAVEPPRAVPAGFRMPWADLCENRPGQSLEDATDPSYLAGLAGEQRTAGALTVLERRGHRVLHAVPLSPRKDIDHLVIGPTGILAVNTKASTYPVSATPNTAVFSDGYRQNWIESIARDAAIAAEYLSLAARMEVTVRPLVAVWSTQGVKSDTPLLCAGEQLAAAIEAAPADYPSAWVDVVHAAARRSDTWTAHH